MAYAQSEEVSYYNMSLSELLDVQITTVSKRLEPIENAPGIVTVVNRSEIEMYGGNDLHDLLRRVPGVIPHTSHLIPDNLISIRGQHSSVIDRRNLILINGRPLKESQTGGSGATFYNSFPLSAIERVEIVRGPGSVLYGSNAFSGVVNVVTRKDNSAHVEVYGGSFETSGADFYWGGEMNDWSVSVSGHGQTTEGWDFDSFDITGQRDAHEMGESRSGLFARIESDSFNFEIFDGQVEQDFLGSDQTWPFDSYDRHTTHYGMGYDLSLSEKWNTSIDLTHNDHKRDTSSGLVDVKSRNTLVEVTVEGEISDKLDAIIGATYTELESTDIALGASPLSGEWQTLYSQLDYSPIRALKVTIGGQFYDSENDSDALIRGAFLWKINEHCGLKVLYGEAYRSPYLSELYISIPDSLKGNPELLAEEMKTYDIQFYYHADKLRIDATIFDSTISDSIGFAFQDGLRTFVNKGESEFYGYEIESSFQLTSRLLIESSLTHQKNKNEAGIKNTVIEPSTMLKLGLAYSFKNGGSVAFFNTHYASPQQWSSLSSNTQELNENTGGITI